MFTLDDGEVVREADQAAAIVEGRGETNYVGPTKVISARIPTSVLNRLQALANKSGKTRNATVITLLEVGIEEVRARLSAKTLDQLAEIEAELNADEFEAEKEA